MEILGLQGLYPVLLPGEILLGMAPLLSCQLGVPITLHHLTEVLGLQGPMAPRTVLEWSGTGQSLLQQGTEQLLSKLRQTELTGLQELVPQRLVGVAWRGATGFFFLCQIHPTKHRLHQMELLGLQGQ